MFIVAVTRWGPDRSSWLPELARELGLFPYDLRMRLNGPLPAVVAKIPEQERASRLMAKLRGWGHGAVGCDPATVPSGAQMRQPRDFEFDGELLRVSLDGGESVEVAASEVLALIHAMTLADTRSVQETTTTKFSAVRAMASGGMMLRKKETKTTRSSDSSSEERIYLILRSLQRPLLFRQHGLRYGGLGGEMSHSSMNSFAALAARLRGFAPQAYYDTQLLSSRRKSSFVGVARDRDGGSNGEAVSSSNLSEVELAAHLILVAHLRGQL